MSLEQHRRHLFGLGYRLTGTTEDAEDVVQETFRRAIEAPPPDGPSKAWLTRVAVNLGVDALRRRRARSYHGPWLPAPVPAEEVVDPAPGPEARYGLLESASFAFLLAAEALSPKQRAALLLHDVLGLSGPEVAEVLSVKEGNARVLLHRARAALSAYEGKRRAPGPAALEALSKFLAAVGAGDAGAAAALLAEDARAVQDGGGEVLAAGKIVRGKEAVLALHLRLRELAPPPLWLEVRELNGAPAVVVQLPPRKPREPTRFVLRVEVDAAGAIEEVQLVAAPRKLLAVSFDRAMVRS